MIGTLPTIRDEDMSYANITPANRYHALNNEILRQRGGRPIRIDIAGVEQLVSEHRDIMLEAAITTIMDLEDSVAAVDADDPDVIFLERFYSTGDAGDAGRRIEAASREIEGDGQQSAGFTGLPAAVHQVSALRPGGDPSGRLAWVQWRSFPSTSLAPQ